MASDYLLVLDGITGESKDKEHAGAMEIMSWSLGGSNPASVTGGGLGAGKVNYSSLNVMKNTEKADTKLLESMSVGTHINKVTLHCRKQGDGKQQKFVDYVFEECLVESYQASGSDGGGSPVVSVSIAYAKLKIEYFEQSKTGSTTSAGDFTYDIKAAAKS